jgi:hypothetical protein
MQACNIARLYVCGGVGILDVCFTLEVLNQLKRSVQKLSFPGLPDVFKIFVLFEGSQVLSIFLLIRLTVISDQYAGLVE